MHRTSYRNCLQVSLSICCLVLLSVGSSSRAAGSAVEVSCEACVVIDGRGRVLWKRNADTPLPNASTTKMVTALLVERAADLDDRVTVSHHAASTGGGGLDLLSGDVYSVDDLLHALLLSSSNDAAVALAEHVAGSESAFVAEMNRWASRRGLDDTHFATPHGLDVPGHESSATDLAAIGAELLKEPVLADIVATQSTTLSGPSGDVFVENRNVLLETYRGALGIKTGMTLGAGEVLVAAARRGDDLVLAVAMRSLDAAGDAAALLDVGFKRLRRELVLETGAQMGEVVLDPGGTLPLTLGRRIAVLAPKSKVEYVTEVDKLPEAITTGDRVGTMSLVLNEKTLAVAPLLAGADVDPPSSSFWLDVLETLLGFGASVGRALGAE